MFILTRPITSADSSVTTQITDIAIAPSIKGLVDSFDSTLSQSAKWIVTISNPTSGEVIVYEVLALFTPVDIKFNRYGVVGDKIKHLIEIEELGPNIVFSITNNETNNIIVSAVRIQTT